MAGRGLDSALGAFTAAPHPKARRPRHGVGAHPGPGWRPTPAWSASDPGPPHATGSPPPTWNGARTRPRRACPAHRATRPCCAAPRPGRAALRPPRPAPGSARPGRCGHGRCPTRPPGREPGRPPRRRPTAAPRRPPSPPHSSLGVGRAGQRPPPAFARAGPLNVGMGQHPPPCPAHTKDHGPPPENPSRPERSPRNVLLADPRPLPARKAGPPPRKAPMRITPHAPDHSAHLAPRATTTARHDATSWSAPRQTQSMITRTPNDQEQA